MKGEHWYGVVNGSDLLVSTSLDYGHIHREVIPGFWVKCRHREWAVGEPDATIFAAYIQEHGL